MAKVFRFHDGSNSIEDWQTSTAYGKTAIEAIKDPNGSSANKEITSIPSPFARMDLVKTAFENLVNLNQVDGKTIFNKMVSDCLDVGEIFFNSDKLKEKINIIVWDKANDLNKLLHSSNPKHKLLGETLKLYLDQDAKAYNFDKIDRLYLLNYKKGNNDLNIIGGTSPATLFFTSANKLDIDIQFGTDIVFDDHYQPLYKRDFNFQKFIFGIRKFMPNFNSLFKGVDDYLEMNYKMLSHEHRTILNNYTEENFQTEFEKLAIAGDGIVEILGFPLRKKTDSPINIQNNSGFVIDSEKYKEGSKPLVLPIDNHPDETLYITAIWDRNNRANISDDRPIKERTLPYDDSVYPYLTISDFLEPYIIRTIYPIDNDKFFNGNFSLDSGEISKGFLLPVKKEYFDYFNVEDLQGVTSDGKKTIEIKQSSTGGVNVTLRIPIKNRKYVTYERTYYPPMKEYQIPEPDLTRNKGAIIENQFGLTLFPFLKLLEDTQNFYRIAFMDRDILDHNKNNKYSLYFFKNKENKKVIEKAVKQRSEKAIDNISSEYYVLEEGFDYIVVKNNWANGVVMPLFRTITHGAASYTFAVDFGTTNTHIEYRKDNGEPKPFEITQNDMQTATLYDLKNPETIKSINAVSATRLFDIVVQELIPEELNKNSEFHFPQRTIINSKKNLDLNRDTYALSDFNIPFDYEKYPIHKNSFIRTNLKWSNYTNNPNESKVIDAYFENLLFLIRNKVLLNGGDLNKTKLIWLYPSSMSTYRINQLESKWNELFKKYINKSIAPEKISESIAPFYYYNTQLGVNALANPVVSIDIGGGTTDVVVYTNNNSELLTSFRFAANDVFGDAFGRSSKINGFILKYLDRIKYLLELNKQYDLLKVLEEVINEGKSEDMVAFFFSIEQNKKIKDNNTPISFSKKLKQNDDFKIIFLLFYTSIIYHIAKLMKAKSLNAPRYITFSGTGSKIINIADGSDKLNGLTELTQIIFKDIFNTDLVPKIDLKQDENPKEISCKGALMISNSQNVDIDVLKTVLLGTKEDILIPNTTKSYNDINSTIENEVVTEYNSFIDWFFSLNKQISFNNNFGINQAHLNAYKDYLKENALDNLKIGLQEKKNELKGDLDENIDETLFFYPLIGGINHLAFNIHTELNSTEA